ncbi:radical SAM protein [Methylocystis heyeri]|uniref:Radical SAM protein n=1 Tax=Methylocystis heyeri TaxID=391905 RepID=A0A6B8KJE5_9HYPH|nr:radical SAM protein [Methylocystis heyeri]QGM47649.1 radical SAM protein [Methylocystis heyeri]
MSKLASYASMMQRIRPLQAMPKVWNYLKYRTRKRHAVTRVSRSAPQIASLLLTKRCNLTCDFCNVGSFLHDENTKWKNLEANLETVKKIFENPLFDNCLLVDLLGGEPLLVKELAPIVSFLTKRGHLTNITTNGTRLLRHVAELRDAGISRICVSIYEENRAVIERDLAQINAIFPVHTCLILFRKDVENAPDALIERVRYLRDSGCLDVRFWMYRPIGETASEDELLFEDDPCYLSFKARMDEAVPGFCFWPAVTKQGPLKKLCPQLWQRVGCDMSGRMAVCCGTDMLLPGPEGNIFESDPDVVYNHPILVQMREQLLDPNAEPPEMCKTCNLLSDPGW